MARGRFISREIIIDKKVNELSSDTARLAFTWMITLADKEGRVTGDEYLLKAALFPRRKDITPDVCVKIIDELADKKFILVYQDDDEEKYIQFLNFEKHQKGLRKDREADSAIPHWENCFYIAGVLPDEFRIIDGRIRVKVKSKVKFKDNGDDEVPPRRS